MRTDKLTAMAVFIVAMIASKTSVAELASHDAPFGLRFGMKLQEVKLPLAPPPEPPKKRPPQPSGLHPGLPQTDLIPDQFDITQMPGSVDISNIPYANEERPIADVPWRALDPRDGDIGIEPEHPDVGITRESRPIAAPHNPLLGDLRMKTIEEQRERREQKQYENAYDSLVKACQATFDTPSRLNFQDGGWLDWIAAREEEDELTGLDPVYLLDRVQYEQFQRLRQQVERRGFPKPTDFRKLSIHKIEAAGEAKKRIICLVFTEDGLTHVYAPRHAFEDVINDIYERLDGNREYATYKSRRYSKRHSDRYHQTWIAGRQFWLHSSRRVMVSSKYFQAIDSFVDSFKSAGVKAAFSQIIDNFTAHIETTFRKDDFEDGLLPYIAYTDLARRAETYRLYRYRTLPTLTAAIKDAMEVDNASKKLETEIERAKNDKEKADRKSLVESFR